MVAWAKRATIVTGLAIFFSSFSVYLRTLTPTVPFWDPGEFIAVARILGIPHPPGTPFFVMIGRLASLLPIGSVAQRVIGVSSFAAAVAAVLTYLCTLRLLRIVAAREAGVEASQSSAPTPRAEALAQFGAVMAGLMLAFSDNFWKKAIDGEVFSMMSLGQILTLWVGLKWWEGHEKRPNAGLLLACVYFMWVCVGLHLGVGMMGLPLIVLVWLVDRPVALAFSMPFVSVLGVTYGMEYMSGIVVLLSLLVFGVYAYQGRLSWWVWIASAAIAAYFLGQAFRDIPFTFFTATTAVVAVALPLVFLTRRSKAGGIIAVALVLMVLGFSTHLYLPIRAAQHPAINEGNPSSWESLRDLLERKQYGHNSMFERRAPWSAQLDKEFWRYWKRQWPLAPRQLPRTPGQTLPEPRWWSFLLPLLLGGVGLWKLRGDRVSWLTMVTLFAFSTVGMVLFLNFTDHEVRDRDYFFTTAFHVYAIFIGIGAAWVAEWVRDSFDGPAQRWAAIGAVVLLGLQPFILLRNLWFVHDRSHNYVARDYAYDMLAPLAKDSYIFTNGDNDTFPLWYMQYVENFRKDVRVINLSLLNTDWYIEQLKSEEPKVPMALDDATIKALGGGAIEDSSGKIIYTNQFMVQHIIEHTKVGPAGWSRQPYFAVTVPEHMGYDSYFSLEGLAYRVNRDTTQGLLDERATHHNLYDVFKYRGLFKPDGSWDTAVYKDENASTLSRNYAAAHLQLAFHYRRHGEIDRAITEMERVSRMFPDYTEVLIPLGGFYLDRGDTVAAMNLFHHMVETNPTNAEVHYYYGVTLMFRGQLEAGVKEFDTAIQIDPNYSMAYYAAYYALRERGIKERALSYLERWVDAHPTDTQARALLEGERGGARQMPAPAAPPLPRPNLP
jgi:Flp pilus assembly protein TadD